MEGTGKAMERAATDSTFREEVMEDSAEAVKPYQPGEQGEARVLDETVMVEAGIQEKVVAQETLAEPEQAEGSAQG